LPNIAIGKTSTGNAGKHLYFKYAVLRLQCIFEQNAYARYAIVLFALLQPPRRCIEYSVTNLQLPCWVGIAAGQSAFPVTGCLKVTMRCACNQVITPQSFEF
jgi:hypothetical protein